MLAARLTPLGDRLVSRWPAQPETLASIRHLMRRWLRHHGVSEDQTYDVMVACQEACANAVEHAYAPGEEAFEVEAELRDGTIEITVRDHGGWRSPRGRHRGRGMPIMHALMDSVQVEHTADGTAVVLRSELAGRDTA